MSESPQVVGTARRLDGRAKVTGEAGFAADLRFEGLLHARLVLSPYAAGRIRGHDSSAARSVPGVEAVLFHADLTVPPARLGLPMAGNRVRYAGEPVALVLGVSEAAAADGAAAVVVDYEPESPLIDMFEALAEGAPSVLGLQDEPGDDSEAHGAAIAGSAVAAGHPNIATETRMSVGDVDSALNSSAHRVRGRWTIPPVHQAPLETAIAVARPEPDGGMTVWTSTQAPFLVRTEVSRALGVAPNRVRIVSTTVGGGFGLKAIAQFEVLAAVAARSARRPVRLELTRNEQFQVAMAGACTADIELGADAEGRFTGARFDVWFDSGTRRGGYTRGVAILLTGTYRLPAFSFHGRDVTTNKPPGQPYRAPSGVAFYHLESAIDSLAQEIGMDPIELRLLNASRAGDPSPRGPWPSIGLVECLEAARLHPLLTSPTAPDEAIGVAAGLWTGVGGPAYAGCLVEPDGGLTLQVGYADISGSDTSLAIIAADVLGLQPGQVRVVVGDTHSQPFSGQSGGSRTVYAVGSAVEAAALDARKQLLDLAAEVLEAAPEDLRLEGGAVSVVGLESRRVDISELVQMASQLTGGHGQGPIYGTGRVSINDAAPMTTVHLCRVKVDRETGSWRVTAYAVIQDVGHAINRPEIEGQIHGGVLQSLGRALGEQLVYSDAGVLRTAGFLDYAIPTIDQAPPIEITLIEVPSPLGPMGARGVGEPPAIPPAAAVANALRRLTGLALASLPVEWEDIAPIGRRSEVMA